MKPNRLLLILSTVVATYSYAAQEESTDQVPTDFEQFMGPGMYVGPTYIENKKLDHISVAGPAAFEGVTVSGKTMLMGPAKIKESSLNDLHISGPLDARKTTLKTLNANGPVKFERVAVDGKVTINGTLSAEESNFKNTISIATDKMTLDHSMAENIEVRKNMNWLEKPQKVVLTNKTVVKGNITFQAGNGIVYLKKGAILKGSVKGGKKVEKENGKK